MPKTARNKIILDIIFNALAVFTPVLVLQIAILPMVAKHMEPARYGLMLTLISVAMIINASFGASLANVRLLLNNSYRNAGLDGDFNIILLIYLGVAFFAAIVLFSFLAGDMSFLNLLLPALVVGAGISREYFSVAFRLSLDFFNILADSAFLCAGYASGFFAFLATGRWEFIYLLGFGFSLVFIAGKSPLFFEPLRKTPRFGHTASRSLSLCGATACSSLTNYIDRPILFAFAGGSVVSVYYISCLLGKIIGNSLAPVNIVMLSYFARMKNFEARIFYFLLLIATAIAAAGYLLCLVITEPLLRFIYGDFSLDAMKYVHINNATAMLAMVYAAISPAFMKMCDLHWQIFLNISNLTLYAVLSLALLLAYGLTGFCLAGLLAGVLRVLLLIAAYRRRGGHSMPAA